MRYVSRGLMAVVTTLAAIVITVTTAFAAAPATYSDSVSGVEYSATAQEGKFAGYATGGLPGLWNATVHHTALTGTGAKIDGGTFTVASTQTVTGTFDGGSITPLGRTGCNETFSVVGSLTDVGGSPGRKGEFNATLTHYGFPSGGSCTTYAASVSGTVTLELRT